MPLLAATLDLYHTMQISFLELCALANVQQDVQKRQPLERIVAQAACRERGDWDFRQASDWFHLISKTPTRERATPSLGNLDEISMSVATAFAYP